MIGKDEWLEQSSLASNSGRIDLHDQLDQEITEWTQRREEKDVMNELKKPAFLQERCKKAVIY